MVGHDTSSCPLAGLVAPDIPIPVYMRYRPLVCVACIRRAQPQRCRSRWRVYKTRQYKFHASGSWSALQRRKRATNYRASVGSGYRLKPVKGQHNVESMLSWPTATSVTSKFQPLRHPLSLKQHLDGWIMNYSLWRRMTSMAALFGLRMAYLRPRISLVNPTSSTSTSTTNPDFLIPLRTPAWPTVLRAHSPQNLAKHSRLSHGIAMGA